MPKGVLITEVTLEYRIRKSATIGEKLLEPTAYVIIVKSQPRGSDGVDGALMTAGSSGSDYI